MILNEAINAFVDEYFFLSNFYVAPVKYDGILYHNNEAAFQAQKCADKSDRIKFADLNPTDARNMGRKIPLRKDWEQVKISIMSEIVKAKFEQNPDLAQKLIDTKDTYLEEGNTWGDRTWGTVNGNGANNLGRILMNVRAELQKSKNIKTTSIHKKNKCYER